MNWNNIISAKRWGSNTDSPDVRTGFQRDFDRLIFSSAFRRLQNKTQVFPLPGSVFVHNRLTHSLEVASVGRSLGKLIGERLIDKGVIENEENREFYKYELQNVIAAACLAHDIGNPPFGHSGESAISSYFKDNENYPIEGEKLKSFFNNDEWSDLVNFEGNANSLRTLTYKFNGKSEGGYRLTYTTLAAILKYPCVSPAINKENINTKKYSFFDSDRNTAIKILDELNVPKIENAYYTTYKRHPFVYLTEAADDICYRIIDFEDAQRLNIVSKNEVEEMFMGLFREMKRKQDKPSKVEKTYSGITDKNEAISYLRAVCINALTYKAADLFMENADNIISGSYNTGLLDALCNGSQYLTEIEKTTTTKIYNHNSVVQLEITGYKIMNDLLSLFIPAILKKEPTHKDKKIRQLLPGQFVTNSNSSYLKVLSVLDYVSGMTDPYAVELYRKLFGMEIPKHN